MTNELLDQSNPPGNPVVKQEPHKVNQDESEVFWCNLSIISKNSNHVVSRFVVTISQKWL